MLALTYVCMWECSCWWHWASGKQSLHWHVVLCGLGALLCRQRSAHDHLAAHTGVPPFARAIEMQQINKCACWQEVTICAVQQCAYECFFYNSFQGFFAVCTWHTVTTHVISVLERGTMEPQFPTYVSATVSTLQTFNAFLTLSTLVAPALIAFPWSLIFA